MSAPELCCVVMLTASSSSTSCCDRAGRAASATSLAHRHDLDLHEERGVRERGDLERGPARQVRLRRRAEELRVALHEAREVHPAALRGIADEEDLHLADV